MTDWTVDRLRKALAGNQDAVRALVDDHARVIQARVARVLLRRPPSSRFRQEVEDLVQDVFLHLFERGGRVLRNWDPARGLSLENYVGLVAERKAYSVLRRGPKEELWDDPPEL